jgi:hypothetical protein
MKADTKPTLDDVAIALCKGATPPEWVIARLRQWASLISYRIEDDGEDIERLALESALHLERLLPIYARAYEMIGEEYPDCIDTVSNGLYELIPFLTEGVERRRGPKLDLSRHLCAAVCMEIWREVSGKPQPHSPKLWEACEAYWVACGYPENPSGHIKNWEDFLLKNIDPPSN